jgi:hypothetical protein
MNRDFNIERITYEQCPYDAKHIQEIYVSVDLESICSTWTQFQQTPNGICSYRKRDNYFQFISGDPSTSLFQEAMDLQPMETEDDAEWEIEKHDEGRYVVRSVFTKTFGPSTQIQRVDELLSPFGLWLEYRESFVWGAVTFDSFESEILLQSCRKLVMLEEWCLEANRQIETKLDEFWGNVRREAEERIHSEGVPIRKYDISEYRGKRRAPLPLPARTGE